MIFNQCGLALVAVPWLWVVTLKLMYYTKQDLVDCAVVPHLGVMQHGIHWTLAGLEWWIMECCLLMGYQQPCMPTAGSRSPIWSSLVARSCPGFRSKSMLNCPSLLTKSSSPHNCLLPRQSVLSYQWTRPSTIQVCQHCVPSPISLISALADHLPPGL